MEKKPFDHIRRSNAGRQAGCDGKATALVHLDGPHRRIHVLFGVPVVQCGAGRGGPGNTRERADGAATRRLFVKAGG